MCKKILILTILSLPSLLLADVRNESLSGNGRRLYHDCIDELIEELGLSLTEAEKRCEYLLEPDPENVKEAAPRPQGDPAGSVRRRRGFGTGPLEDVPLEDTFKTDIIFGDETLDGKVGQVGVVRPKETSEQTSGVATGATGVPIGTQAGGAPGQQPGSFSGPGGLLKMDGGEEQGVGPGVSTQDVNEARSYLAEIWPLLEIDQRQALFAGSLSALLGTSLLVAKNPALAQAALASAYRIQQKMGHIAFGKAATLGAGKIASRAILAFLGAASFGSVVYADTPAHSQGYDFFLSVEGAEQLITFDDDNFAYFASSYPGLDVYLVQLAEQVAE